MASTQKQSAQNPFAGHTYNATVYEKDGSGKPVGMFVASVTDAAIGDYLTRSNWLQCTGFEQYGYIPAGVGKDGQPYEGFAPYDAYLRAHLPAGHTLVIRRDGCQGYKTYFTNGCTFPKDL